MADESARPEATETGPPGLTGEQPGAGQQQPGKQNWWIWIVIGVVIIAAAAFFFLSNQAVAVPDVVGMTLEEATAAIEDVGLVVGSVQEVEDSEGLGTPGVVLAQSPEAGAEANEGDAVELEVLGEKEMATVPDIVGLEQAEAEAAITEAGLEPATYEEYDEEVPAGAVYGQAPDPGTKVEPGSKVVVGVSKGPAPASAVVPDVVGQSEADATKAIGDAGLKPEVFRAYDDTVAKGVVTRQSPSASAEVVPGTTVGLLVSE
jgi:beta-lactam-binding protein with PASTA domain